MRRTVLFGPVLLLAILPAAGCSASVPRASGPAGPVISATAGTGSPASAAAPAIPSPPASSSPPAPASSSPATTGTSGRAAAAKVLGPAAYGALRLGMTYQQANATGLVVPWKAHPLDCHATTFQADRDAKVYPSDRNGIQIIEAPAGAATPEGIHIGSSQAALYEAYPNWRNVADENPHADGRGMVPVPGNSTAYYRIVKYQGKVVELALQLKHQNCYE